MKRFQIVFAMTACAAFCARALLAPEQARAMTISTVYVGDPGNTADANTVYHYGSVGYGYNIGMYDVTDAQYAEFLNAVDPTGANALQLYNANMATGSQGGITWNGSQYVVNSGCANKPAVYVSWHSAARFTNWLTNGQGSGGTETGVYTLTGLTSIATLPADHSALVGTGTKWFLPTENEWYKAAYYCGGSTNAGYWAYPFQSNTQPTQNQMPGGSNSGNFNNGVYAVTQASSLDPNLNYLTDVGAYASACSPYGSYDMGGDIYQWNETQVGSCRGLRGGYWGSDSSNLAASVRSINIPESECSDLGFRVAALNLSVPEPSTFVLAGAGVVGLIVCGWRRKPFIAR